MFDSRVRNVKPMSKGGRGCSNESETFEKTAEELRISNIFESEFWREPLRQQRDLAREALDGARSGESL